MAKYVGQQAIHLDVRPKRAAFLFRTNSKSQFRDAVERASSRWGGIQEPIVPVSAGGRIQPAWNQIIEALEPDIAFELAALDHNARAAVAKQLQLPVLPVKMESRPSSGAHPLVIRHRDRAIYASTSKGPAAVAGPGLLPTWDSIDLWEQGGIRIRPSDDQIESAANQILGSTVIEASGARCGELYTANIGGGFGVLWVAQPSSIKDALWFWNLRALMPRSFAPARAALITPQAAADPRIRDAVKQFRGTRKWTTPDVLLMSLTVKRAELAAIASQLGFDILDDAGSLTYHLGRERESTEPLTARLNVDPRPFLLGEREAGVRTTSVAVIEEPKTVVRLASPVRFASEDVGGRVRVRLSGPILRVPHREPVARLFLSNAAWKQGGLEVDTDALLVYQFEFSIPSRDVVLREAVAAAGLHYELSQPGRLGGAVADMLQPGQRPFADPAMRAVVNSLTTKRSKTLARELVTLTQGLAQEAAVALADRVGPQLTQVARPVTGVADVAGVPRGQSADRLEHLVRLGLAERGLLVACDRCKLSPFVPLHATTPAGTCPACRSEVTYAANVYGELEVHYRLNALLDRASDQGVVAHLGVLDQLAPDPDTSYFVLGAQLFEGSRDLGEMDLLGYDGDVLMCGEVKSSAGGFSEREILKTFDLGARMAADIVLFGCAAELTDDVIETLFAKAERYGVGIRVVDPRGVKVPPPSGMELPPMT